MNIRSAVILVGAALIVIAATGSTVHALDKCKVKLNRKDGTILVSAKDVTGPLLWGTESGSETNAFSNAGTCVADPDAKKCELGLVADPARITPPELCTLFLVDAAPSSCSAYIKGCTPGLRNAGISGEGFVKAWAMIDINGDVVSCYNCNPDPLETRSIAAGGYEVDFTPLAEDITGRPRSVSLDEHGFVAQVGEANIADRGGDPSSVFVSTRDAAGVFADKPFLVMLY